MSPIQTSGINIWKVFEKEKRALYVNTKIQSIYVQ